MKTLAYTVLLSLTSALAQAEPIQLSAAEIDTLLRGNTAIGQWGRDNYRQHFSDSGSTIYAVEGRRSSRGLWRVNSGTNAYESWWERSGWSAYDVLREDGQLYWLESTGDLYEFVVVEGQQLLFEN